MAIGLLPQTTSPPLTLINDLRAEIAQLCLKILPEAVTLTDAFGYTDWELDRLVPTIQLVLDVL